MRICENSTLSWPGLLAVIIATILIFLGIYKLIPVSAPFFNTSSPNGIYLVNLTGQKERPRWFTVEVYFDVFKDGNPFWSQQLLHSGDAFDLSFEIGYPDHVWLDNNILRFYDKSDFTAGKAQIVSISNTSDKSIRHMKVEMNSTDKFLIFDLQPGSEEKLLTSAPKGDYAIVSVEGEFYDGKNFDDVGSFRVNKQVDEPFEYHMSISNDRILIESSNLQKHVRSAD